MSQDKTVSIMLFVLGLFLIALGVVVEMPTETYIHSWGKHTIHPYEGAAAFLIIVGVIVLVAAFIKARTSKKTVSMTMEMPKTEQKKTT